MKPELLQLAFMKNSDSVAIISENRHMVCNEAYARMFSYDSVEEIGPLPITSLVHRDDEIPLRQYLKQIAEGRKEERSFKARGIQKGGSSFFFEISASHCNPHENEPPLFLVALRENSRERLMEDELERSRRSLSMIKRCHQILLRENREQPFMDKICSYISETGKYDLTWYSLKKEDGALCTSSFSRGKKEIGSVRSLSISNRSMREKATVLYSDLENFTDDDEEKEHLLAGGFKSIISLPLLIDGQVEGTLNIHSGEIDDFAADRENLENLVEDICHALSSLRLKAKQSELERQLLQAQKMETIGTLAGGIAHDFNNIMTPILGYSEIILAKMSSDNPFYNYNQQIFNGAIRAKELVKQILAFSHKEHHKKESLHIDKIVKETLQLMSSLIPKTIRIHKHLNRHIGKVMADSAQLHQVIANLCTNSFHAMEEEGGHLTVELKRVAVDGELKKRYPELKAGDYAQLIIADTGKGMSAETKSRLFEPFFTTKPVGKGTGLGLSVVHGIIKNHQGVISVDSEINLGTVFRIFLPLLNAESERAESESRMADLVQSRQEGKRIMLIDDHHDITELLKIMLINRGYAVESFNDSRKALESLQNDPHMYSLIITDMHMPEVSGLELIKEMKRKRENIPAIIITGHEEELSEWEKKKYNIRVVIHKPILRDGFIEAVAQSLSEE